MVFKWIDRVNDLDIIQFDMMTMGRITRDLKVWGTRGKQEIKDVLLDGGASISVMRKDLASTLCGDALMPILDKNGDPLPKKKLEITLGDGETKLQALGACGFSTVIDGRPVWDEAWVTEKLSSPLIIGARTLQQFKIHLNYEPEEEGGDSIELGETSQVYYV